jgi:hypothetical protein
LTFAASALAPHLLLLPPEAAELREDTDWMEVTDGLQRRVLREFGVPPHLVRWPCCACCHC